MIPRNDVLSSMMLIIQSFTYNRYENPDGTMREEESEQSGAVHGRYSYRLNGVLYTVNYKSDSNGFKAEGDHLPKPIVISTEQGVNVPSSSYTESHSTEEHVQSSVEIPSVPSEESHQTEIIHEAHLTEERRPIEHIPPVPLPTLPTLPVNDASASIGRALLSNSDEVHSSALRSESVVNPDGTYHYMYVFNLKDLKDNFLSWSDVNEQILSVQLRKPRRNTT